MFERFTDRARHAVVEAQNASKEMLQDYIGTEHLLFGILRDNESVGTKVLNALGVTIEEAKKYARSDGKELGMVFQFEHVGEGNGKGTCHSTGLPSRTGS